MGDWANNDLIVYTDNQHALRSVSLASGENREFSPDARCKFLTRRVAELTKSFHWHDQPGIRQYKHLPGEPRRGAPRKLTFGNADQFMRCTPDGKLLVYYTFDDHSIRTLQIEGGQAEILIPGAQHPANQFGISPDGKQFVVAGRPSSQADELDTIEVHLWSPPTRAIMQSIASDGLSTNESFAPDGKSTAYLRKEHGVENIWLQPISGGAPMPLTDFHLSGSTLQAIISCTWSPDGKHLALSRVFAKGDAVVLQEPPVKLDSGVQEISSISAETSKHFE